MTVILRWPRSGPRRMDGPGRRPSRLATLAPQGDGPESLPMAIALIPQHSATDDQPHDLVGAFEYLVHTDVAQDALNRMIAQIAVAAMQLQAAIDHLETRIGRKALGLRG